MMNCLYIKTLMINVHKKFALVDMVKEQSWKNSIIHHPLLSFSVFNDHLVIVTRDGLLLCIGNNEDGRICGSFKKEIISEYSEFTILKDDQLIPPSAVCTIYGTLYLFSKENSDEKQLIYCDLEINEGETIFFEYLQSTANCSFRRSFSYSCD